MRNVETTKVLDTIRSARTNCREVPNCPVDNHLPAHLLRLLGLGRSVEAYELACAEAQNGAFCSDDCPMVDPLVSLMQSVPIRGPL